jgi:hypothetical protein
LTNKINYFDNSNEKNSRKGLLHPSERDYNNITSSNQKYCASIFYREWQLKSQTLFSQYMWFEQFESNVVSKMDPSHIDETGNFIDGSNGKLNIGLDKISVMYAIMEEKLILTVTGENQDLFIKRGTKFGFEYGTINQAGKTVRIRKLQSWGFLDFIRINKKSPHEYRIFEISLDLYEDYKNKVNYVTNEKRGWINYSLNKNRMKKPSTWMDNKSAEWVCQTKKIRNIRIRDFFFNMVKPLRGYLEIINAFNNQTKLSFVDVALSADFCITKAVKLGKKGILNCTMNKIVNNRWNLLRKSKIIDPTKVREVISDSDAYLAHRGLKRVEVDNENRGATRIFINRMRKMLKNDIELSPLVKYGILTIDQCRNCEFEIGWGLTDWKGFLRSDNFAPDILITNGIMGPKRKIFAVIQLKGRSRKNTKSHATNVIFQLIELKKYEVDAGINTAMVIIEPDNRVEVVKYSWLIFNLLKYQNDQTLRNIIEFRIKMRDYQRILLDPTLYRNARNRKIVEQVYDLLTFQPGNLEQIEKLTLKLIIKQITRAYDRFAEFTSTSPLRKTIGEVIFIEFITIYVNDIKHLIKGFLNLVTNSKINNYPLFQKIWNKILYEHYYNNILRYLGIKPVFNIFLES